MTSCDDLAQRPSARGAKLTLDEHVLLFIGLAQHAGGKTFGALRLGIDEGSDSVKEELLCGVGADGVHADGCREQAASVEEEVQVCASF